MLILTRRLDERIIIGENISVSVLSIDNKRVKIGIDAPPDVAIYRQEIHPDLESGTVAGRQVSENRSRKS